MVELVSQELMMKWWSLYIRMMGIMGDEYQDQQWYVDV